MELWNRRYRVILQLRKKFNCKGAEEHKKSLAKTKIISCKLCSY